MRNNIGKYAATIGWPVLVTTLILLAWEISVRILGIRSIILPPPSAVVETKAHRPDLLLTPFWAPPFLTLLGFLLSLLRGLLCAPFVTHSPLRRKRFFSPLLGSQ